MAPTHRPSRASVDALAPEYTGCVARDRSLAESVAVTLALKPLGTAGSGSWWYPGDPMTGGGRWGRPPFEWLVTLVGRIMDLRSVEPDYSGKRRLTPEDRSVFTRYVRRKVTQLRRGMQQDRALRLRLECGPTAATNDEEFARWVLNTGEF